MPRGVRMAEAKEAWDREGEGGFVVSTCDDNDAVVVLKMVLCLSEKWSDIELKRDEFGDTNPVPVGADH
jgi:hypothetical protein